MKNKTPKNKIMIRNKPISLFIEKLHTRAWLGDPSNFNEFFYLKGKIFLIRSLVQHLYKLRNYKTKVTFLLKIYLKEEDETTPGNQKGQWMSYFILVASISLRHHSNKSFHPSLRPINCTNSKSTAIYNKILQ